MRSLSDPLSGALSVTLSAALSGSLSVALAVCRAGTAAPSVLQRKGLIPMFFKAFIDELSVSLNELFGDRGPDIGELLWGNADQVRQSVMVRRQGPHLPLEAQKVVICATLSDTLSASRCDPVPGEPRHHW